MNIVKQNKSTYILYALVAVYMFFYSSGVVLADAPKMSMTVTPAFFRISLDPGESWSSYIEVTNEGTYDTNAKIVTMDFDVREENGGVKYAPDLEGGRYASYSPAQWISVDTDNSEPLSPRESAKIPFTIAVPQDAEPGGYYVGLLVGDHLVDNNEKAQLRVANLITSLIFVNVTGDIIERGRIREFFSEKSLYNTPEARFFLGFENKGTVHLIPRGDITVYNMWGEERGTLALGSDKIGGVVLPESIEKFEYNWKGKIGYKEYGRYKVVATIYYGTDSIKREVEVRHFWVLPTNIFIMLGTPLLLLAIVIGFYIRKYVRRTVKQKAEEIFSKKD